MPDSPGGGGVYLAVANDLYQFGGPGSGARLWAVNVSTSAASAVVTIYHGTSASAPVVATIDASAKGSYVYLGAYYGNGLFVKLTGGNALVTVIAD